MTEPSETRDITLFIPTTKGELPITVTGSEFTMHVVDIHCSTVCVIVADLDDSHAQIREVCFLTKDVFCYGDVIEIRERENGEYDFIGVTKKGGFEQPTFGSFGHLSEDPSFIALMEEIRQAWGDWELCMGLLTVAVPKGTFTDLEQRLLKLKNAKAH